MTPDELEAKKKRAFEDYYNGGEPRSLPELASYYLQRQHEGFDVPTTSVNLLTLWSREARWPSLANERRASMNEKLEAMFQTEQSNIAQSRLELSKKSLTLAHAIIDRISSRIDELDRNDVKLSHLAALIPNAVRLAEFGAKESRLEEAANQDQIVSEAIERVLSVLPQGVQEKIREAMRSE